MRVAVAGALGRMGRTVCAAVLASGDLELVAGFDRCESDDDLRSVLGLSRDAGRLYNDIEAMLDDARPDVLIDFTVYPITVDICREAVNRGIATVIGTTGWTDEDEVSFADLCDTRGVAALLVPNFAIGAVLMMRFAAEAALHFPTVEIIELHHDRKLDRPSGTAKLTARRIEDARKSTTPVPIHSVRLQGLVANQEVLFGGHDEVLTIRHDTTSRESFMAGVLLAVRRVRSLDGLKIGLENVLNASRETASPLGGL